MGSGVRARRDGPRASGEHDAVGAGRHGVGNSRQSLPSNVAPPFALGSSSCSDGVGLAALVPHCFRKNGTLLVTHRSRRSRIHAGSLHTAPWPLCPPPITQPMPSNDRPGSGVSKGSQLRKRRVASTRRRGLSAFDGIDRASVEGLGSGTQRRLARRCPRAAGQGTCLSPCSRADRSPAHYRGHGPGTWGAGGSIDAGALKRAAAIRRLGNRSQFCELSFQSLYGTSQWPPRRKHPMATQNWLCGNNNNAGGTLPHQEQRLWPRSARKET